MKIRFTFACQNRKKLVKNKKVKARKECFTEEKQSYFSFILEIIPIKNRLRQKCFASRNK